MKNFISKWFSDFRWGSLFLRLVVAYGIGYFGAIQAGANKSVAGVAGVMALLTTAEAYSRNPKTLEWKESTTDELAVKDSE